MVELMVAMAVASVLMLGVLVLIDMMNTSVAQCQRDQSIGGDLAVAYEGIGWRVRKGIETASRKFAVYSTYSSFRSSGSPVADGAAGTCLVIPNTSPSDDAVIYSSGGALYVELVADANNKSTLVSSGMTGLSFTAQRNGSPPARTGAILVSVSATNADGTVSFSSTMLPRDR